MANTENDILEDIRRFLGEDANEPPSVQPVEETAPTPPSRPPKVGTVIQRSDYANRKKQEMMTTPPPPLSQVRRRIPAAVIRPPRIAGKPLATMPRPPTPPKSPSPLSHNDEPAIIPPPGEVTSRDPRPVRPTPGEILRPTGPRELPPIWVELEPGYAYPVSYHAVHVARRYRPRTPRGRWSLRFDRRGQLRFRRKIE